jgi:hypothetical protein
MTETTKDRRPQHEVVGMNAMDYTIATPEDIADAEADVADAMAARDSIRIQLEDEATKQHRGSNWVLRARIALAHRKKDLAAARADLKALKSGKRFEAANWNLQNQKEKHKLQIARVHAGVMCADAKLSAIIRWVRENYPERIEEVYAARDAAQSALDAKP